MTETHNENQAPSDRWLFAAAVNWADPEVPAGNAPPLPVWPAVVTGAAWCIWVVVLAVVVLYSS